MTSQAGHDGVSALDRLDLAGRSAGTGDTSGAAAALHQPKAAAESEAVALAATPAHVAVRPAPAPHTGPGAAARPPRSRFEAVTGGVGGRIGAQRLAAWNKYEQAVSDAAHAEQVLHDLGGGLEKPSADVDQAAAKLDAHQAALGVDAARQDLARLGMDVRGIQSRLDRFAPPPAPAKPSAHPAPTREERGAAWQGFREQRDTGLDRQLIVESRFEHATGDLPAETLRGFEDFTASDLFGGHYLKEDRVEGRFTPEDRTPRKLAEDSYRQHLHDAYQQLADHNERGMVPEGQWRAVHERLQEGMPLHFQRIAQRERAMDLFEQDFAKALEDFRRDDLFGGRYLPPEDAAGAARTDDLAAAGRTDDLAAADHGGPAAGLHELRLQMMLKYGRAVDRPFAEQMRRDIDAAVGDALGAHDAAAVDKDVVKSPAPGRPGGGRDLAAGSLSDESLAGLRADLAHEIAGLSDRERWIQHATESFDTELEKGEEDLTGGHPHLDEETGGWARADFQKDLRAAHTRFHGPGGGGRGGALGDGRGWETHVGRATGEHSLSARLRFAEFRQFRMTEARRVFDSVLEDFDRDFHLIEGELNDAQRTRLRGEFETAVDRAVENHWFGHMGRPDFRFGGPGDAGRVVEARPWNEAFKELTAGLHLRFSHELQLETTLSAAARDFHGIVGHPDSVQSFRNTVREQTIDQLGKDFRERTVEAYDKAWSTIEHDIKAWLRHEAQHENLFHESLNARTSAPLDRPRIAADGTPPHDTAVPDPPHAESSGAPAGTTPGHEQGEPLPAAPETGEPVPAPPAAEPKSPPPATGHVGEDLPSTTDAPGAGHTQEQLQEQLPEQIRTERAQRIGARLAEALKKHVEPRPPFHTGPLFDARRVEGHDGFEVTEVKVKVAFTGEGAAEHAESVLQRIRTGVAGRFGGVGRTVDGGRLRISVQHVPAGENPHLTVELAGHDRAMDAHTWWHDAAPGAYADRLGEHIGLLHGVTGERPHGLVVPWHAFEKRSLAPVADRPFTVHRTESADGSATTHVQLTVEMPDLRHEAHSVRENLRNQVRDIVTEKFGGLVTHLADGQATQLSVDFVRPGRGALIRFTGDASGSWHMETAGEDLVTRLAGSLGHDLAGARDLTAAHVPAQAASGTVADTAHLDTASDSGTLVGEGDDLTLVNGVDGEGHVQAQLLAEKGGAAPLKSSADILSWLTGVDHGLSAEKAALLDPRARFATDIQLFPALPGTTGHVPPAGQQFRGNGRGGRGGFRGVQGGRGAGRGVQAVRGGRGGQGLRGVGRGEEVPHGTPPVTGHTAVQGSARLTEALPDVARADLTDAIRVRLGRLDGTPVSRAEATALKADLTHFDAPGAPAELTAGHLRLTDVQRAQLVLRNPRLDRDLAAALGRPEAGRDLAAAIEKNGAARADLALDLSAALGQPRWAAALTTPGLGKALAAHIGRPELGEKLVTALHGLSGAEKRVLWQPGYATGDQFGIAAALMGDKDLHVVVVTGIPDRAAQDKGPSIAKFYQDSGIGKDRVHLVEMKPADKNAGAAAETKAQEILGVTRNLRKDPRFMPVAAGTTWVAENFSVGVRRTVRAHWKLDETGFPPAAQDTLGQWLEGLKIAPSPERDTIVLWSRFSGKKGDVHVEHDTSYTGVQQILTELNLHRAQTGGKGPLVVIAGDASAVKGDYGKYGAIVGKLRNEGLDVHDLTNFWEPDRHGATIGTWGGDSRIGQMRLYEYLRLNSASVRHLGFRSGNLEALALSGHTVRYMEEPGSVGGDRMAKWHAAQNSLLTAPGQGARGIKGHALASGYERLLVDAPPTRSGKYIFEKMQDILQKKQALGPNGDRAQGADLDREMKNLLHPKWVKGAGHGIEVPKEIKSKTKGFASTDLRTITGYLTGGRPVAHVPGPPAHGHAAVETLSPAPPATSSGHATTSRGTAGQVVAPRAPQPVRTVADDHVRAHDNPAAVGEFTTGPKDFLEHNTVLLRMKDGMETRTPGLAVDYSSFLKWMDKQDRHWFALTPHGAQGQSGRPAYLLTPAIEKYAHEFAHDPELREIVGGHDLPAPGGTGDYLAAHYVPYYQGASTHAETQVGHTRIPVDRGGDFNPDFVFTAGMNGCAFAVTRSEHGDSFTAWHYQSPTSNRKDSERFRLDRRPVDWFGDCEYQDVQPGGLPESTNLMWRGDDGWRFVSQENHADFHDADRVWTNRITTRPVRLTPGQEWDYVARYYQRTAEDRLVKLDRVKRDYVDRLDNSKAGVLLKSSFDLMKMQAERDVDLLGKVTGADDLTAATKTLAEDHASTTEMVGTLHAKSEDEETIQRKAAWPWEKAQLDEADRLRGQVRFFITDAADGKWLPGLQRESAALTEPPATAPATEAAVHAPAPHAPVETGPAPLHTLSAPAPGTSLTDAPGWQAARSEAVPLHHSGTWMDPVSRPMGAGRHAPRYTVTSSFDVRRFSVGEDRVTDLTVRVDLGAGEGVHSDAVEAAWTRALHGVERVFNAPAHRMPDGSLLHVTLERAGHGEHAGHGAAGKPAAHMTVTVDGPQSLTDQFRWSVNSTEQDIAHEIGHQLGLRDEYRDATAPGRASVEGSLMGNYHHHGPDGLEHGGMRDRYLRLLQDAVDRTVTGRAAHHPAVTGGVSPHSPQPSTTPPPVRMTRHGQLGGADRILPSATAGTSLTDGLLKELEGTLSPGELTALRAQWEPDLRTEVLPALSAMTRGETRKLTIDVGGWSGEVRVTARVEQATTRDALPSLEFEDGTESFQRSGFLRERLTGGSAGLLVKGKAAGHTDLTGQASASWTRTTSDRVAGGSRVFSRGKTPEPALTVDTVVRVEFDFSGVGGRLGRHFDLARATDTGRITRVTVPVHVPVATSAADATLSAAATGEHFLPPARIEQTLALGGTDIVRDVFLVDGEGRRTTGSLSDTLLGTGADPSSLTAYGKRKFGQDWPEVRQLVLARLDSLDVLQFRLKGMTGGDPLEIDLGERGALLVTAEVTSMEHLRTTDKTEFNTGADVTRVFTLTEGRNRALRGGFSAQSSDLQAGPVTLSGELSGQYEHEGVASRQVSVRSGSAVKMKVSGAVFDGVAKLTFTHRAVPAGSTVTPAAATAAATAGAATGAADHAVSHVGFQTLVEAAESRPVETARAFTAAERPAGPLRMAAPHLAAGDLAWRPAGHVWDGLPEHSVVLDVLLGEERPAETAAAGGAQRPADVVDHLGRQYLRDEWDTLRTSALDTVSREQLTVSLPPMTRGTAVRSVPLTVPLRTDAQVSATARLDGLEYLRTLDAAEINLLSEITEDAGARLNSAVTHGEGLQGGAQPAVSDAVTVGLHALGVSRSDRRLSGNGVSGATNSVAGAKYPEPMVVFLARAHLDTTVGRPGDAGARTAGSEVRFVVAVPQSHAEQFAVAEDAAGPQVFTRPGPPAPATLPAEGLRAGSGRTAEAPPAATLTSPAPALEATRAPLAFQPPERVRTTGRIGAGDAVLGTGDGNALVSALKEELGGTFEDGWQQVEGDLHLFFDGAVLPARLPGLTAGTSWGTKVTAGGVSADIRITRATATMTKYLRVEKKFEFERGSESTSGRATTSTRTARRGLWQRGALRVPHTAITLSRTRNTDTLAGRALDARSGVVAKGKTVEPAALFEGEIAYTVDITVSRGIPGMTDTRQLTVRTGGAFGFPVRDLPVDPATRLRPQPAQHYRPPRRTEDSLLLGASDIVLGADFHAGVLDQLDTTGARVYGSAGAWRTAKDQLRTLLPADAFQRRLRPMMAGQPWVVRLGSRQVIVTASVREMTHAANTDATEFHSAILRTTGSGGPEDAVLRDHAVSTSTSLGVVGTSDPVGVLPVEVFAGGTVTHTTLRDDVTESAVSARTGTGTKSKVPGSVFDGRATLHVEFRQSWRPFGRTVDQRVPRAVRGEQARIGALRDRLADATEGSADALRLRAELDAALAGQTRAIRDRAAAAHSTARGTGTAPSMTRTRFGVRARAFGEAELPFQALVETADAVPVTAAADARITGRRVPAATPPATAETATRTVPVPPTSLFTDGLSAGHVVRDLPDVRSLRSLLDTQGRHAYGGVWDAVTKNGRQRSDLVMESFHKDRLMAALPEMTRGGELRSETFHVNGRKAWVSATATVERLVHDRPQPKAEVALVHENSAQVGRRALHARQGYLTAQLGALAGDWVDKLGAAVTFGGGFRSRRGGELAAGGRTFANAKVPVKMEHFDGSVRFTFTFHHGGSGAEHSGVVPFAVGVPTAEITEHVEAAASPFFDRPPAAPARPAHTPATPASTHMPPGRPREAYVPQAPEDALVLAPLRRDDVHLPPVAEDVHVPPVPEEAHLAPVPEDAHVAPVPEDAHVAPVPEEMQLPPLPTDAPAQDLLAPGRTGHRSPLATILEEPETEEGAGGTVLTTEVTVPQEVLTPSASRTTATGPQRPTPLSAIPEEPEPAAEFTTTPAPAPAAFTAVRRAHPDPIAGNDRWTMWGRNGDTPHSSAYAVAFPALDLRGVYAPPASGDGLGTWHWYAGEDTRPVAVTPLTLRSPGGGGATADRPTATPVAPAATGRSATAALAAAPWSPGLRWRSGDEDLYVFSAAHAEGPDGVFARGLLPPGDHAVHPAAHAAGGTDGVGDPDGAGGSVWLTASRDIGWLRGQAEAVGGEAVTGPLSRYGWRYDIAAPGGVDVNETLDLATPHPERREVLFPGGVDGRYVRGAQRLDRGRPVGPYVINPGFSERGTGTTTKGTAG
ncbi:scabin-related ADP-ribosyltransferase [Actinacidiphila acidipaludis]|uniref:Pierisin-like domain-containing protein n=1 Tax=Actinacidiphila acidipaludis TaxID=2873382 RepID=A0ABS7QGL0_9ACTN|nr:hypothetical protein [Streptomyces acidipaludis]MBY8882307.1 hypothetical protein [Streptomyces acidipaludis]